jgi:glucokinase
LSLAIGIDLGGTKVRTGIVEEGGTILAQTTRSTEADKGFERICISIIESIDECLYLAGKTKSDIDKIGIGAAGQIDPVKGEIIFSPNLNWRNAPLAERIYQWSGSEVWVENDVRVAALAEMTFGAGRGTRYLVCIFVGTGVGAGIIIDGKLLRGFRNMAGEVGHTKIKDGGYPCTCGGKGCLEAHIGGAYLKKRAIKAIHGGVKSLIEELSEGDTNKINTQIIEKAYRMGDSLAKDIWTEFLELLSLSLANLITLFNPERIVLGGGVIEGSPSVVDTVKEMVPKFVSLPSGDEIDFRKAELGPNAGVIGATLLPLSV